MVQPMRIASVLAFLAFPILEIGILIRVGQAIGFWPLLAVVLATAMLGTAVIRGTGLAVLASARRQFTAGTIGESNPLLDGLLRFTAGMLLIFPGLIADVLGALLLVPQIRTLIVKAWMPRFFAATVFSGVDGGPDSEPLHRSGNGKTFDARFDTTGKTIEGEYERISEKTIRRSEVPSPPGYKPRSHQAGAGRGPQR